MICNHYTLTLLTGTTAKCPTPSPKANLTTCKENTKVCYGGVRHIFLIQFLRNLQVFNLCYKCKFKFIKLAFIHVIFKK